MLQIVDTDYTSTQTTIDPGDVVTFACFTMDFSSEYGDRVIQEGDYAGSTGLGKFGNFIKDDGLERKELVIKIRKKYLPVMKPNKRFFSSTFYDSNRFIEGLHQDRRLNGGRPLSYLGQ